VSEVFVSECISTIRAAMASGEPLRVRGSGSKDFLGNPTAGAALELAAWRGIVDYDPAELVLTARTGTLLVDIETELATCGQMLAFEPPHFGTHATLGGCVASGLAGPRRLASGPLRDSVLGVRVLDGRGRDLHFGGRVMKNVAGYDLARLMAGAFGTLGVLLEVSLKVLPCPAAECTLRLDCAEDEALRRVNGWLAQPWPISGSSWRNGVLHLRLSGSRAAIERGRRELGGDALDEPAASEHWRALREQTTSDFDWQPREGTLWRVAVPPTTPPLLSQFEQQHEWGGTQRWLVGSDAALIREAARAAGGHAVAFRNAMPGVPVFAPSSGASLAIQRRLLEVFDPARIFNRGRLVAEH
jgi:glycolate oxidase FAD binding subunit